MKLDLINFLNSSLKDDRCSNGRLHSLFFVDFADFLGCVRICRIKINWVACKIYLGEIWVQSQELSFLLLICLRESIAGSLQLLFFQVLKIKSKMNLTNTRFALIEAGFCEFTQKVALKEDVSMAVILKESINSCQQRGAVSAVDTLAGRSSFAQSASLGGRPGVDDVYTMK